jgi:hypothetical protein
MTGKIEEMSDADKANRCHRHAFFGCNIYKNIQQAELLPKDVIVKKQPTINGFIGGGVKGPIRGWQDMLPTPGFYKVACGHETAPRPAAEPCFSVAELEPESRRERK